MKGEMKACWIACAAHRNTTKATIIRPNFAQVEGYHREPVEHLAILVAIAAICACTSENMLLTSHAALADTGRLWQAYYCAGSKPPELP